MNTDHEQQKSQWKKDAAQLKKDLNTRPKVVKKNEVDIKFGGTKKQNSSDVSNEDILKSSPEDDLAMRRFLGI